MKDFQLPAHFLSYLDGGSLRILSDGNPSVNFKSEGSSRIVDVIDVPITIKNKPGLIKQLSEAKDLAKNLKKQKITLEIRFKGDAILKLGKDANPKLAKIVTLSNDIEITNLTKLKKLSDVF